jgi:6-pyruvoyltetrahydropterin/6-carboxytetrahydropterin synthase
MLRVSKKFHFCAAHRLIGHKGLCKNLHGHRYELQVFCEADEPDDVGCTVDFGELKDTVGEWIDAHLDHATMVFDEDTELLEFCMRTGSKRFYFSANTTVENMIQKIYVRMQSELLNQRWRLVGMKMWESPNNCVTYTGPKGE